MSKRPKLLKVVHHEGSYQVKIRDTVVGRVEKTDNGEFKFSSDRDDMPIPFEARTMAEIRDALFDKIDRATYMRIADA